MSAQGAYPDPGEMIGPYRIGRRLGMGGMGIVFEALDTQLNRRVALKVISPELADDETFRARFTREAQAQASLDSPHVVHVYAHGAAAGRLYIATQLIPGGDLGEMIRHNGAPPARVGIDLIAQIASGLSDAHATGLIHRDIKPANVLLRRRDSGMSAYLADFGIARQVDSDHSLTTLGSTIGTPSYMAPELHTGARPGITSDVYSLGCLLWATLSGHAPYTGTSDYQLISAHFSAPIPQLAATGAMAHELNRVLRAALAKQPEERYGAAGALRDELQAVLRMPDDAVPVRPAVPGSPLPPPTRPPTPTPPGARGTAPAAYAPSGQGGPAGSQGRGLRIALVVAAVIVLIAGGIGLAYALTRDGGSGEPSAGGSSPSESGSSPSEPTESASSEPPPSTGSPGSADPPDYTPRPGDEQKAIDQITQGLLAQGGTTGQEMTPEIAGCVAEGLVDDLGVERLVETGFLDEELNLGGAQMDTVPSDVQDTLISVSFECAADNAS